MLVIFVAYLHPLCCYIHIHTALVSLLFGTVILTSFYILMEMFLHLFHWFFVGYLLVCVSPTPFAAVVI